MKGPKSGVLKARSVLDKNSLHNEIKCVYLISLGQKKHDGEYLEATVHYINSVAKDCTIVIADTLQRYNYYMLSKVDSYLHTKKLGDLWLEEHKETINKLEINYRITRWDDWLNHRLYSTYKNEIDDLFEKNEIIKKSFYYTANNYLLRHKSNVKSPKQMELSLEYLKEECPIIIPIWMDLKYDYIFYPGNVTSVLYEVFKFYSVKKKSEKAKWVSLEFKRYSLNRKVDFVE